MGTSIRYDTGLGMWAKMEYSCNLRMKLQKMHFFFLCLSPFCSIDLSGNLVDPECY